MRNNLTGATKNISTENLTTSHSGMIWFMKSSSCKSILVTGGAYFLGLWEPKVSLKEGLKKTMAYFKGISGL